MTAFSSLYRHAGFAVWLLTGTLALSAAAAAEDGNEEPSALALRGFATFALARSSSGEAEMMRDLSQPRGVSNHWSGRSDSVLGLQANYRATDTLEAVAQAVSRYHSEGNFRPELAWAFLKYEPSAYLSLRGGRIGTEFFMGADSRLIGYSYLTVRPSHDFYLSLPFSYFDGGDAQVTAPLGEGILRGKVYAGLAREKIPIGSQFLDIHGAPMAGGFVEYQEGAWMWRASYGQIRFNHELPAPANQVRAALSAASVATSISAAQTAADDLSVDGKVSRFYSLGAIYDKGPLQVHAMFSRNRHDSVVFENAHSAMLLVGYRVGDMTPFAGYSKVKSKTKQLGTGLPNVGALAAINAAVVDVLADSHSDQSTATVGLRWDFSRNKAFKLQADAIRGTPQSIFPYRRETLRWNGHTNVLSMSLDFIF